MTNEHVHEWERGRHMAIAFGIDGRTYACAVCGVVRRRALQPFRPDYAVHPGETMAELIEERGWTQKQLADRCIVTQKHVSEVINGKAGIGPRFAVALERATGVTAEFWMRLQINHDIAKERKVPPGPPAPPPPPKDREYA